LAVSMASGAGAAMIGQFGRPRWTGSLLIMGLSLLAVLGGLSGVVASIAAWAPLLVAGIWVVSLGSLGAVWPSAGTSWPAGLRGRVGGGGGGGRARGGGGRRQAPVPGAGWPGGGGTRAARRGVGVAPAILFCGYPHATGALEGAVQAGRLSQGSGVSAADG